MYYIYIYTYIYTFIYINTSPPTKVNCRTVATDLWVGQTDLRRVDVDLALRHFAE